MDLWYLYVSPFIGGLIIYVIIKAFVRAPGASLRTKFQKLGVLKGKTLSEIVAKVGQPNSVSMGTGGVKIRQWMAAGYHIVLLFDENDICLGVNSETNV